MSKSPCVLNFGSKGTCRIKDAGNPPCFAGRGGRCVETSAEEARNRLVAAAMEAHRARRASRYNVGEESQPQRHTVSGRPRRTAKDYNALEREKLRDLRREAGRI